MVTSKPTKSRLERQKRSIQKAHPYDGSTKISEIKSIVRQHRRELELEDQSMSAAKFYVPTLPGMPEGVSLTMYAGEVPSSPKGEEGSPHLFFFFMRNKHVAGRPKLLLWFNGGPGCSSFDGALMEVGPLRMVLGDKDGAKGKLREAEGAWNEYTNILFIDQPAGTGYSYVDTNQYVHELPEMAAHVVQFMKNWYKVFPEYKNQDTYISGESYAGQYIPYIADAFLKTPDLPTQLKGLLIGNGWIDPPTQYASYLEFGQKAGIITKGSDVEKQVTILVNACLKSYETAGPSHMTVHNSGCEGILGAITASTIQSVNGQKMCVNNYDVRLTDTHPACGMNWPPDLTEITPYLQRPDVKSAFHADRKTGGWVECNGIVGSNFWTVNSLPSITLLASLLEQVPILLFAGDQDLICNYVGVERLIEGLTWGGETGFGNTTAEEWHVNGKRAGTWTTSRNLTYVKIADASHMVGYDQPLASHDMLVRFIGVDLLAAAGSAAQVPSRIGNEEEAVLGETHPNGTAVVFDDPVFALPTAAPISDSAVETLVNTGSAIVVILIMLLAGGVFFVVRSRMHKKNKLSLSRGNIGLSQHNTSHELEELVVDGGEYQETSEGRYNDVVKGKGREREEIFNVGDDEEEEEDDGTKEALGLLDLSGIR